MRVPTVAALIVLSLAVVSCADMPTAPRGMVTVSGLIQDREGKGIQAVYVYLEDRAPRPKGTDPLFYRLVTNIEGRFTGTIPEGTYDVDISPPQRSGYAPVLIRSKAIPRSGMRLDYKLDYLRVAIHPSVIGGQPISAMFVTVWPEPLGDFIWQRDLRVAGDEREAFVPPGNYEIYMSFSGVGFGYPTQTLQVAVSGDTTLPVTFSGNAVAIHVTGQGGQPMDSARVWAFGTGVYVAALTDAGGFATVYAPNGTYELRANGPTQEIMGRQLSNVAVSGDASYDFDLSGTTWTGMVQRNGSPLANVGVVATPVFHPESSARSVTDESGAFHLVVKSGDYYRVMVYELIGGDAYAEVARIDSVAAGADSTLQILAHPAVRIDPGTARWIDPTAAFPTPAPPGGPGGPASAVAGPAFRRRSSRTAE